ALARSSWIDGSGTRLRRVVEEAPIEMARVRSDVLNVERRARPQLALDVEAPLVLARVGKLPRRRDHVRRNGGSDGAERPLARQRGVRGIRGDRRQRVDWRLFG